MSWSTLLSPLPNISQNTGTTSDGQPSENASLDCAEACICNVTRYITGVALIPDNVNDQMFWEGHVGSTTPGPMRSFLLTVCSIPTTMPTVTNTNPGEPGGVLNLLWSATVAGHPAIVLKRYSDTVNTSHWVTVFGLDPSTVTYVESWTGTVATVDYATFARLFLGDIIEIDRTRDTNL
jgi:hypothetical protein